MSVAAQSCFHCGLPVPADASASMQVLGEDRYFCCPGCLAVCETIVQAGLADYYRHRTQRPGRADPEVVPDVLKRLSLYDRPEIQRSFVRSGGDWREASLILEDVRCAACLWLNEQHLRGVDGVLAVEMDYASERAVVRWDPERVQLSQILQAVADIGYVAYPYDAGHRQRLVQERKRRDASRLIFAAAVGMPVMQFSLASYIMGVADEQGALPLWVVIGRWSALFASAALLFYSGWDFFAGAWRDLRNRRLGMDLPIVIGLSTAFLGSVVATVREQGEVYFDSIAMFVLFVLLARIYELRGRLVAANAMDTMARVVPQTTRRQRDDGAEEPVATVDLRPGDRLLIAPGESLPVDGRILEGRSGFDESLLTGESSPRHKGPGECALAGSINLEQPVLVEVQRVGEESTVGEIRHLLNRGVHARPPYAVLAERAAEWFVAVVLFIAAATAGFWIWHEPGEAIANTVAVLIVTCPCALALATPVAVAIAAGRFTRAGVLPLRMSALEVLATADTFVLDKTGTLTEGRPELVEVITTGDLDREHAVSLAGSLEQGSRHPLGIALRAALSGVPLPVEERRHLPGEGVSGWVEGREWRLGKPSFALTGSLPDAETERVVHELRERGDLIVGLGNDSGLQALFVLRDALRLGASRLMTGLRDTGVGRVAMLSGDASATTRRLADRLGIHEALGDLSPAAKLEWIKGQQARRHRVVMVGDGINDAPTLAAADASISFVHATEMAQYSSDFLVLVQDLEALVRARRFARRTRRIIFQNLAWAASYNLLAVPAAALGLVPPWAAAIGMSASSLIVVANALRLRHGPGATEAPDGPDGLPLKARSALGAIPEGASRVH